jgi:hypothetical protein
MTSDLSAGNRIGSTPSVVLRTECRRLRTRPRPRTAFIWERGRSRTFSAGRPREGGAYCRGPLPGYEAVGGFGSTSWSWRGDGRDAQVTAPRRPSPTDGAGPTGPAGPQQMVGDLPSERRRSAPR